jgi:hypothetical protein
MPSDALAPRELNGALLQRPGLLARSDAPAVDMIEQVVGMQAQVPENPYLALWSRLNDFHTDELSGLIADRHAVRARSSCGRRSTSSLPATASHSTPSPSRSSSVMFKSPWSAGLADGSTRSLRKAPEC